MVILYVRLIHSIVHSINAIVTMANAELRVHRIEQAKYYYLWIKRNTLLEFCESVSTGFAEWNENANDSDLS